MYYPQQSPGISHKLANHHDNSPWRLPMLVQQQGQQSNVGPPPQSPGYALYPNGPIPHHPGHLPGLTHPPLQHHHQSSISHYPSPPNPHSHQQHLLGQGSPAAAVNSPHWQAQLLKYDICRSSRGPHHRARANIMASRNVTKSAIPITNPNLVKPPNDANGKDTDSPPDASPTNLNGNTPTTANHPSSTVPPVEPPRPTQVKVPESTWNSLDMGGLNIKNVPSNSGLFSFTFLVTLYLNHNALNVVPSQISKLRHLKLLDLSGNNLSTLPPELGLLTQLKELFLYDNQLSTIPYELGTLHQLQTLGVEGNPLDGNLKNMLQKDGTHVLIAHLRDNCPVSDSVPQRPWHCLISPQDREQMLQDPNVEIFSILSYNILCEKYATERLYGYTPSWALQWSYRKDKITTELLESRADFLCLQEVDIAQYEEYFQPRLGEEGYLSAFWPKSRYKTMNETDRRLVDGCATFYKADKYKLVEKHLLELSALAMQRQDFKKTDDMFNRVLGKDHIAVVCLFENINSGSRLLVANVHIAWDPNYRDVKLVQVGLMLDEIEKIASGFAKYPPPRWVPPKEGPDGTLIPDGGSTLTRAPPLYTDGFKIPLIVAGDFNSIPESTVYEFMASGSLPYNHPDFMGHMYGRYTTEGLRHRLGLKSAYSAPGSSEPSVTNFTPSFQGALDYLWYSTSNLAVNAVLGDIDPDYLDKQVGFPNVHFPSDHVRIMSEFRMKLPKETAAPHVPRSIQHQHQTQSSQQQPQPQRAASTPSSSSSSNG